jgi:dihydroorotate dehydrogenase (fumarate)
MEFAGAAAIEINPYAVPGDLATPGSAVEKRHLEIVSLVKESVSIPVAVKLSPFFSSTGAMVRALDTAGVDGFVLFNRFLQPDIDIETLQVHPAVTLSTPIEAGIARTWIAILHGQVRASLAATTGVESAQDVIKYLLAGADVVMTASALLRHGPEYAADLLGGLESWLARKGFDSLDRVRGALAVAPGVDAAAYERAGYVSALQRAKETYGDLRISD